MNTIEYRCCFPVFIVAFVTALYGNNVLSDPSVPLPLIPFCGDQGEGDVEANCSREYSHEPDMELFTVRGFGQQAFTVDYVYKSADFQNGLNAFIVDDLQGSINGVRPADEGYQEQVENRAIPIFPGDSYPFTADVITSIEATSIHGFYITNGTDYFYSIDSANADNLDHFVGFKSNTHIQFGFEDLLGGGDLDYDDIVFTIDRVGQLQTNSLEPLPPVTPPETAPETAPETPLDTPPETAPVIGSEYGSDSSSSGCSILTANSAQVDPLHLMMALLSILVLVVRKRKAGYRSFLDLANNGLR